MKTSDDINRTPKTLYLHAETARLAVLIADRATYVCRVRADAVRRLFEAEASTLGLDAAILRAEATLAAILKHVDADFDQARQFEEMIASVGKKHVSK